MPLRLDIKRKLLQRTDRVKCVDLHPTEPWMLASLYSGHVLIWNTLTSALVKSFEVTELPVRSVKFVPSKQWIIAGADDMLIRVYNYNTMDKVKTFEAHTDYIRCITVHPTLPLVISASDDMLIKLWDWEKGWACTQIFEGHIHYVMQVVWNPKDTNTFASASLDRTIKVWSIGTSVPNFTLEGHEKGVNCIDYFTGGDRPYLVSGADDKLTKIWDYQTKSCVQTLEGHTHNISAVCFHPELPIVLTGSEDGTIRIWHSTTYRLENSLNYGMERVWSIAACKGSNRVAFGYDEGAVMIKLGREEPVASMDANGKIIYAKHNEVQSVNVKALSDSDLTDGERLPLAVKDIGSSDVYPQILKHSPNGRFVVACGDGEYIIYTALQWRNKAFGNGLEFAWSADPSVFAVRETPTKIKTFKSFQEKKSYRPDFSAEGLFGGALIALKSKDFVCFYDWDLNFLQRIDVSCKQIYWNDTGELVTIVDDSSFYMLRYNREVVDEAIASGQLTEEGVDDAFELLHEVEERVRTGAWAADCFIYTTANSRLNYCVGGEVTTLYHLDKPMFLLGYIASQNRLYLIDKEFGIISYTLLLSLIEYKTLVMREDMEGAAEVLPSIPQSELNGVARFLEAKGYPDLALEIATENDYKFELAVQLEKLEVATEIAKLSGSEAKWKQLGELAMSSGKFTVSEDCLNRAGDMSGLLLLYSSSGNKKGIADLAEKAESKAKYNVSFLCYFLLGELDKCIEVLCKNERISEAAFFARTYLPSKVPEIVEQWKRDLSSTSKRAADALASPDQYPNLFPDFEYALKAEELLKSKLAADIPAIQCAEHLDDARADIIAQLKEAELEEEVDQGEEVDQEEEEGEEAVIVDENEEDGDDDVNEENDDAADEQDVAGDEDEEEVDDDWGMEEQE